MFYTITFNPAIDLVMNVPTVQLGELNRTEQEDYVVGGKGINMSVILHRLGQETIATGFLGGFTGTYIQEQLHKEGVQPHFIQVDGTTRINVKLKSEQETEINAAGPTVSRSAVDELFAYLERVLQPTDTVLLAGNAAPGMSSADYVAVATICQRKQAKFVLDATKELLLECLPYRPFVIKPNHHELGELFHVTLHDTEAIVAYARKLQAQGARNVIVSRGGDGAVLVTESNEVYCSNIPDGKLVNSVGAGDSMLAGFMAEYTASGNYVRSLQLGAATGSATAFSVGIADKALIEQLVEQVIVENVKI